VGCYPTDPSGGTIRPMAVQLSVAVRNARLDAVEATIGVSAVLKIFTGAQPANCAAANTGTELVSMNLPVDWMAAAGSGTKAKAGVWSGAGVAAGTAVGGHYRIYASDGVTCGEQGSAGATGSGADLTIDNAVIAVGQVVTVNTYTFTDANA